MVINMPLSMLLERMTNLLCSLSNVLRLDVYQFPSMGVFDSQYILHFF
jgi:hypothetical protein